MTTFRREIAGLRALAVASVVLFHLKLRAFAGGFVGVDVFFVISGYLITRGILIDLQTSEFSFSRFYGRRTRRIYPALVFTVAATYLVGGLWCSPLMFLDLAKECTHALLSIANIQYWRESHEYFARDSEQLGLLHCWSLSVEEQFYLIWPVFVVLAQRTGQTFIAIFAISAASLVAAVALAASDASAVFFIMPFRIYEFGCGAAVILIERLIISARLRQILSVAGIAAIFVGAVAFKPDMPHLELAILVPCVGASAVIAAGSQTAGGRLLSLTAFQGLGAISYSLYLCHWPIIFFARFIFGDGADGFSGIALIVLTILIVAMAMYRFVERPFLVSPAHKTATVGQSVLASLLVVLPLVGLTHATFLFKGLDWRMPASQDELAHVQDFPTSHDIIPVDGPVGFELVGDSHATQYLAGLTLLRRRLGINMDVLAGASCPILYGVSLKDRHYRDGCLEIRNRSLARIEQSSIGPIILIQAWTFYNDAEIEFDGPGVTNESRKDSFLKLERALEETIGRFIAAGKRVLLFGAQVNADCVFDRARLLQGPLPHAPLPSCPPGRREVAEASGAPINAMLGRFKAKWPNNVELLRPVDYFCDSECATMDAGNWLYFDRTHFTVAGSYYMVRRIEAPLTKFLLGTTG
jgi:peptidoglycan/LPS O-acetylase OafA/YrhL